MCESKTRSCPVEFGIVGFQPVGFEDEIMCSYSSDIEFRAFLMELFV